jgi:hypothetical protein
MAMAVMLVFNASDMTKEQYDALRPIVQWEKDPPEGVLLHSCAFDESGGLHVVDLWESPEHVQNFFETRLKPGFEQLGVSPGQPQMYTVHNLDAFPGIEKHVP